MITTLQILAAVLVVASASVAQAQGGGGGRGRGGAAMQERQAAARVALFEGITLTAEQKTKIDSIYVTSQKSTVDLRASMTRGQPMAPELREKMQAIQAEQMKQVKSVLSAEQNVIFDKNYAARPLGRGRGGR